MAIHVAIKLKIVHGMPRLHSTAKKKNLTATPFIIRQEERLCY